MHLLSAAPPPGPDYHERARGIAFLVYRTYGALNILCGVGAFFCGLQRLSTRTSTLIASVICSVGISVCTECPYIRAG